MNKIINELERPFLAPVTHATIFIATLCTGAEVETQRADQVVVGSNPAGCCDLLSFYPSPEQIHHRCAIVQIFLEKWMPSRAALD